MHLEHGPTGRERRAHGQSGKSDTRATVGIFAFVMCKHPDGRYLIVEENYSRGWWLPAGHVELGETMKEGALRECKEEAGVDIELKGLMRFQYYTSPKGVGRQDAFFYAVPKDPNQPPKSVPDYESRGAKWATFAEIEALFKAGKLRGPEAYVWSQYLEEGGEISPISLFDG